MIDLDKVGEEIRDEQVVRADGHEYRFPGTLSVNRLRGFAPQIGKLQKAAAGTDAASMLDLVEDVLKPLAGPDQTEHILEHVGIQKVQLMISALFEAYGLGEASASSLSSESDGANSTPTSSGSTGSTSDKRSGAKNTPAGSSA